MENVQVAALRPVLFFGQPMGGTDSLVHYCDVTPEQLAAEAEALQQHFGDRAEVSIIDRQDLPRRYRDVKTPLSTICIRRPFDRRTWNDWLEELRQLFEKPCVALTTVTAHRSIEDGTTEVRLELIWGFVHSYYEFIEATPEIVSESYPAHAVMAVTLNVLSTADILRIVTELLAVSGQYPDAITIE